MVNSAEIAVHTTEIFLIPVHIPIGSRLLSTRRHHLRILPACTQTCFALVTFYNRSKCFCNPLCHLGVNEGAQPISRNLQAQLASFRKERHRPTIFDTQRGFFFRMSNWASTLHSRHQRKIYDSLRSDDAHKLTCCSDSAEVSEL